MAKRSAPTSTLSHDFAFTSDADLNEKIAAFQAEHAANGEPLAMDSRRSLGPGKVRVTFRLRPKKGR